MITQKVLNEKELDQLYEWVDGLQLSRPKRNISRDYSDATMMAETTALYFPKIVEMHNYSASNSVKSKFSNWQTISGKVLSRLGIMLTDEDCKKLSTSCPMAIEPLLYEFKGLIRNKQKGDEYTELKEEKLKEKEKKDQLSKVEDLRQTLAFIYEKIASVEKSVENKDHQIKELESIIDTWNLN